MAHDNFLPSQPPQLRRPSSVTLGSRSVIIASAAALVSVPVLLGTPEHPFTGNIGPQALSPAVLLGISACVAGGGRPAGRIFTVIFALYSALTYGAMGFGAALANAAVPAAWFLLLIAVQLAGTVALFINGANEYFHRASTAPLKRPGNIG